MTKAAAKREPATRWIDGKRVDLIELRKRRKLAKEGAAPVEDTRVSDAWARDEARAISARKDAKERAAIKHQRPKIEARRQMIENPEFSRDHAEDKAANFRKIAADVNSRESAITVLASKKAIDECQAEAAVRFRRLFEAMGGKGARAIDYSREFVDGGRFPDPIGDQQIDAGKKLAAAYEVLTKSHGIYAWRLVSYVCGEGRSIHDMTETRRQRDTMTDMLKLYLDCLSEHWQLSTRRKVSAAK